MTNINFYKIGIQTYLSTPFLYKDMIKILQSFFRYTVISIVFVETRNDSFFLVSYILTLNSYLMFLICGFLLYANLMFQDGSWEKISAESEEEEANATQNNTVASRPEFCDLLSERGPCHGSWPRYFYNSETDRCEKFFYGGCNGNENNFHVKMACEAICQKPKKSEDGTIFDLIFGHPLIPNVNKQISKQVWLKIGQLINQNFGIGYI